MNNSLYNLRDTWKQRDGPEVYWVRFETFFIQRLNLCDFAFIMERLAIGVRSIFEPSLRNLTARLSTLVALLVLNSFNCK